MPIFIMRFWEGKNGPYEIRGESFPIYRAYVHLISKDKPHMRGEVLREDGTLVPSDEFMSSCLDYTKSMLEQRK